jgi:hypothetical protein
VARKEQGGKGALRAARRIQQRQRPLCRTLRLVFDAAV